MYSEQLQGYVNQVSKISGLKPEQVSLLNQSMNSYLAVFARSVNGRLQLPQNAILDPLATSLTLLSLSIALSENPITDETEGIHYLVGMGLEQSGELSARSEAPKYTIYPPLGNDYWYRLALAFLHYMAGGFRVQAISVLHHLRQIRNSESDWKQEYEDAERSFEKLFQGKYVSKPISRWELILFGEIEPSDSQERRFFHLARQIKAKRRVALNDLGQGNESEWLAARNINDQGASEFWGKYLENLERRGYTNFTEEQIGTGFNHWLRPDTDLLAILPTGSGKTLIGELKTALNLAQGWQSLWITPMRVLIRQVKRDFRRAFRDTGISVEELPVTDDLIPFLTDIFPQNKTAAVTTPEKLMALLRSKPETIKNVHLVVLDEAQIIFEPNRGATIEQVLLEINRIVPQCSFVLLSAFADKREKLKVFMQQLRKSEPIELTSENRPTRRMYGVITNLVKENGHTPTIQIYPAGLQAKQSNIPASVSIEIPETIPVSRLSDTELAQSVIKSLKEKTIRTVMFVNLPISANSQARQLAENISREQALPEFDIARLKLEIGRESIIESTAKKGIAPHHAGLSRLEQYFAEKWTQKYLINTVVATPTLAQGVNLPFDVSILTFLRRQIGKESNRLSIPEIQNMIGRAGRAGQVSDGICLISKKAFQYKNGRPDLPLTTLNKSRNFFFARIPQAQELIGLSRLLDEAKTAKVEDLSWIYELSGLDLAKVQSLVSFSMGVVHHEETKAELLERLKRFPSMQENQNQIETVDRLVMLIKNAIQEGNGDKDLLAAISRTGMPLELLQYYFSVLRQMALKSENLIKQVDDIVASGLRLCQQRQWFQNLFSKRSLDDILIAINLWRNGEQLGEIEKHISWGRSESERQINLCKFYNHDISMYAQFWGAFAVCAGYILENAQIKTQLEQFQTFVREGVSSPLEFAWLDKLGGLDRVLAHRMTERMDKSFIDEQNPGGYVKRQIEAWQKNQDLIPVDISTTELLALRGVLNDLDEL